MQFDQWLALAIQIPVVVAFMVHSYWLTRTFLSYLETAGKFEREQRAAAMSQGLREVEQLCKVIDKLAEHVNHIGAEIQRHEVGAQTRHAALAEKLQRGGSHGA